ncbi:hypothetical protein EPI10_022831 [Gossypium australe]|uniref:Uncharacterized protein n=1 Tax=Gossypium australe TaxID=47621 RepID=A0A5B6VTN8_9ROSI|nr:hypothetical protein EPI10_022831 [Gossypium australe]
MTKKFHPKATEHRWQRNKGLARNGRNISRIYSRLDKKTSHEAIHKGGDLGRIVKYGSYKSSR